MEYQLCATYDTDFCIGRLVAGKFVWLSDGEAKSVAARASEWKVISADISNGRLTFRLD